MQTLENKFLYWRLFWGLEVYRLAKFLTAIQTEFFQLLSRLCTWDINSFENNFAASMFSYLYGIHQKFSLTNALVFLLSWRYFSEI